MLVELFPVTRAVNCHMLWKGVQQEDQVNRCKPTVIAVLWFSRGTQRVDVPHFWDGLYTHETKRK